MGAAVRLTRAQVRAHRLAAHHLDARGPVHDLAGVATLCGVQDSPPGSALTALAARVAPVAPSSLVDAVEARQVVTTWSMRGAPYAFARADLDVFTLGVLPPTQTGRQHLVQGIGQGLAETGLGMDEATDLVEQATRTVLAGTRLDVNELGRRVAADVLPQLPAASRAAWQAEGVHAPGQPWGEAVAHFCLRLLCLRQVVAIAPRTGRAAEFVLVEEWLPGHAPRASDPDRAAGARAELTRRFLHAHGPSTHTELARWLGVRASEAADGWWNPVAEEVVEVDVAGSRRWLLRDDLDAVRHAVAARGVRLLPPGDPYLQSPDRESIVSAEHHRAVWRAVGAPGVVLVDGEVVATWRARKQGKVLAIEATPLGGHGRAVLDGDTRDALGNEAALVATLRGATSAEVTVQR